MVSLDASPEPSSNGEPDGLATRFSLDDLLFQTVNPDAGVEHFAHFAVLAYEDAAFGIFRAVARMDADALPLAIELRATEEDGKPCLKLRTPRDDYRVAAFGDGRAAFYLIKTAEKLKKTADL